MVETFRNCFPPASNQGNTFSHYLVGLSCFIHGSFDILPAELYDIYKGLLLAKDTSIDELVCYSDSLHSVNLIKDFFAKLGASSDADYLTYAFPLKDTPNAAASLTSKSSMAGGVSSPFAPPRYPPPFFPARFPLRTGNMKVV
ncbi:replication A1-like protein [Trifolium pratense]|uniref:Replication A1-like protein n=1 Tax=Trifolium pratense TaxID=57577 RepID=A0A2K3M0H6_TRIPR|nr:replication A1-like protein [Trifolium pratense]